MYFGVKKFRSAKFLKVSFGIGGEAVSPGFLSASPQKPEAFSGTPGAPGIKQWLAGRGNAPKYKNHSKKYFSFV